MSIDHVLAVVPVSDIGVAQLWYQSLRRSSRRQRRPMETLVEWRITETGWLQIFRDPERAGSTLLNFAVEDLDVQAAQLAARGLLLDEIQSANKGVRTASITDPDGNRITFIGGFRVIY